MQAIGISPSLIRVLASTSPDLLAEMFIAGKVLDAEVISVFQDRAMISFGRGIRLEVALQVALKEGQKVQLQVQPREQGQGLVLKLVQPAQQEGRPPATATSTPSTSTPATSAPAALRSGTPEGTGPAPTPVPGQQTAGQGQTPSPAPGQAPAAGQAPGPAAQGPAAGAPLPGEPAPGANGAAPRAATSPAAAGQQPAAPSPGQPAPPGQAAALPFAAPGPASSPAPGVAPGPASSPAPGVAPGPATSPAPGSAPGPAGGASPAQPLPGQPAPQPQPEAHQPTPPQRFSGATQGPPPEQPPAAAPGESAPSPQADEAPAARPESPTGPRLESARPESQALPREVSQAAPAATRAEAAAARVEAPRLEAPQPLVQPPVAQARSEAGQPPLMWIPIPLENGKQGWAQLQVQEGDPRAVRDPKATHQIRLWWETPALGQVQVTLDAAGQSLTALFTVLLAQIRQGLEKGLPDLQSRLAAAGFDEVRVGCRQALPGENIGPAVPAEPTARLDRRL